jgi:hypothetical protein
MSDADFNAQLASHEDILRHLVALIVKMDATMDELKGIHLRQTETLAVVTQLLQRREGNDTHNGTH